MRSAHHTGIDYSGAQTPTSRPKALQFYETAQEDEPEKGSTPVEREETGHGWRSSNIVSTCLNSEIENL